MNKLKNTTKWAILAVAPPEFAPPDKKYSIDIGGPNGYFYTDNPINELHKLLPWEIEIDCNNFDGVILGLYVNCLLAEGYYIDIKQAISIHNKGLDNEEKAVWGGTLYFKITKEYMGKLIDELEKKEKEMASV